MNCSSAIRRLRITTGLLAGVSALGTASMASAQSANSAAAADTPSDEIVVTAGIRGSLKNSQNIKRRADTVVDALTAEDIGALPDRSVTESLQRVAGVAISHFAAVNDPDHISPEGQNVVIRGLPFVQSQFNGRDAFTANKGRAISFQDIPPELLGSIEVYKNQTADQIEGGIAGNINLITRKPLDSNKNIYAATADINYGDLARKSGQDLSALISHQWETGAGRFGILASISYSELFTRQDSAKVTSYAPRRLAGNGLPAEGGALPGLTPGIEYYVPVGGGISRQDFDRKRKGYSAAAEWESPSQALHVTLQFLRTDTTQQWTEHTLAAVEDTEKGVVQPLAGTALKFNAQNILTSGTLTSSGGGGIQQQEISRGVDEGATTNDYGAHLTWKPSSRLKFDFDGQYTDSTSRDLDVGLYASTFAVTTLDLTGRFPSTTFAVPAGSAFTNFADPRSTFWRAAIDHEDNNKGREYALRADGEFSFTEGSFLKRVKFGARYADRKQTVRSDGYNWGNLSEVWNGGVVTAAAITPAGYGTYNFGDFLRGNSQGGQTIYGFTSNNALNYAQFIAGTKAIRAARPSAGCCGGWVPIGERGGVVSVANGGDGFHLPKEVSTNNEKTTAFYGRIDFGSEDFGGGMKFDGNVGLRWIHTSTASAGNTQFPPSNTFQVPVGYPTTPLNCTTPDTSGGVYNICANTAAQQASLIAFANGAFISNTKGQSFENFLPSVNLRFIPTEKLQFRFAYSKAITRPNFNDLYNYTQLTLYTPVDTSAAAAAAAAQTDPTKKLPVVGFRADARGNPLLLPTKSDNFDLTAEWYFSNVGSLTLAGFYKRLTNVYAVSNGVNSLDSNGVPDNLDTGNPTGTGTFPYTNNGSTQLTQFFGVNNNNRKVTVKGFEIAYQQVFNFLPAPFDGVGFQGSYTYIDADPLTGQANNYGATLRFPGVSKHNANAALFYETDKFSIRGAYSWRSSYLVTPKDVNYPTQPVYSGSYGTLDGTLFYNVTSNFKLGLEGKNLLNSVARTYVQINKSGLQALRAAFVTDRQFVVSARMAF